MAKEKMVTRAFQTTKVTVVGVNAETMQAEEKTFMLAGKLTDAQALKGVETLCHADDSAFRPSIVKNLEIEEKILGVPVSVFMANAVEVERPVSQQKKPVEQ